MGVNAAAAFRLARRALALRFGTTSTTT